MNKIVWDEAPRGKVEWDDAPKASQESAGQAALISGGQWLDKKAAGLREAVGSMPGIGAPIVNALDSADRFMGVKTPDAADYRSGEAERRTAPLRDAHPVSAFAGGFLPDLLTINPATMAVMAAVDPGSAADRAARAGITFAGGRAGEFAGGKIADALARRATTRAGQQAANAPRDAAVAEAQAAGYIFPPSTVAPGGLNNVLEGLAGKASTAQGAAIKNQAVTNTLARRALGMPEGAPLTRENLGAVRKTAGAAYDTLKKFGTVRADDEYANALGALTADYRALLADFPSQANKQIDDLVTDLSRPQFNSASAVELVKRLRADARANLKAFDDPAKQSLGRVQNGAQQAIEDLMERNLAASGNEGFLQVFRNARTTIAKAHTVEDALEESTGKVVAAKIGRKFSSGKPLSGELETIGRTAEAFPKALQNVNTSMPGTSPLDMFAGLMTGGMSGVPAGIATAVARPVVRAGLLSSPYQKAMARPSSYEAGAFEKLLGRADREQMERIGGLLGLFSQRAYQ